MGELAAPASPLAAAARRVLFATASCLAAHAARGVRAHSAAHYAAAYERLAAEALSLGVPRHALPLGAAGDGGGAALPSPPPPLAQLAAAVARLEGIIASRLSSNL
jgi:hypothetical protein